MQKQNNIICNLQIYYLNLQSQNLQTQIQNYLYMDLVSRLKLYIEKLGLQNSQIADMAGIPRPTLSQLLTGRNKKISNELIEKLHTAFPNLNIVWLLFGEGEMLINPDIKTSEPQKSLFPEETPTHNDEPESFKSMQDTIENIPELDTKKINTPVLTMNQVLETTTVEPSRRVQSIMVFYTDNSFEVFEPARKPEAD